MTLIGALSAIVGIPLVLTVILPIERIPATVLSGMVSFAVGCLLSDIFGHILPEYLHHAHGEGHGQDGVFVIAGIFIFFLVDILISRLESSSHGHNHHHHHHGHHHHSTEFSTEPDHEDDETFDEKEIVIKSDRRVLRKRGNAKAGPNPIQANVSSAANNQTTKHDSSKVPSKTLGSVPILMLFANIMHTFTDGMQLGLIHSSSSSANSSVALTSSLAIIMHEIPHKLSDYAINLKAGYSKFQCIIMQLLMSLGTVAGCAFVILFKSSIDNSKNSNYVEAKMMLLSAGGLIYTCMVGILPDILRQARESLTKMLIILAAMAIGVLFVFNQQSEHGHHHHH